MLLDGRKIYQKDIWDTCQILFSLFNYNPKIESLKSVLREYSKRRLSLIGKVTVVKSLAIRKFVHLITALPNPGAKLKNEINREIRHFMGQEKSKNQFTEIDKNIWTWRFKVNKYPNLYKFFKISWIKRLINTEGHCQQVEIEFIFALWAAGFEIRGDF